MGIRFTFCLIFLINGFVFAQTKPIEKIISNNYHIDWKPVSSVKIREIENQYYLSFTGAQNSFEDDFLPRYNEKATINFNSTNFSAALNNSKYEVLSDAEATVLKNSKKITTQIQINTSVLTSQKKSYGVVSFIPIRKNPSSGKFEKLVA